MGANTPVKIFIADGSKVGWQRIRKLLNHLKNVELLGGSTETHVALDSIRHLKPDVVILDIDIPESRGIEFLQQLLSEDPSLRIVVITNISSNHYRKKCIAAGAMLFFDKSTEFHRLPQAIEELCAMT